MRIPSDDRLSYLCSVLAKDKILAPISSIRQDVEKSKGWYAQHGYIINHGNSRMALAGNKYEISLLTQPNWLWTLELLTVIIATIFAGLQWRSSNVELGEANKKVNTLKSQDSLQKKSIELLQKQNQILRDSLTRHKAK